MAVRIEVLHVSHRRTSHRRWLRRALLLLVPALMIACALQLFQQHISADYTEQQTYVVQPGDSLWQIARIYVPERMDIRAFIHRLEQANGLKGGIIHPGQQLAIPGR